MDRQYKAFISYRHRQPDMQAAKMTHSCIEHYIIPKALRKNGQKKLGIVFRDQEELPISGDLSDNIRNALDHSEYLIVICTPETEKSEWVKAEIAYFLSFHDHDHVLTVLAEGSSQESFPKLLREVRSPDGRLIDSIEPLAANIVADSDMKRRRLFRTEKFRILAALIGCPFDELYRREQRYRLRRLALSLAAITALGAGFIGMLLNRNAEIRANYEQALRNQSQYLASESLKALGDGDRLLAMSLAVEALPEEGEARPHVSKAEYALGCAVGAYLSPETGSGYRDVGMLRHTRPVDEFKLNDAGTLLCSRDADGVLAGWDLQSMKKLWALPEEYKGIAGFLNETELVAWSGSELCCIDSLSGARRWSVPATVFSSETWSSLSRVCIAEDGRTLVAATNSNVAVLDPGSRAVLRSFPWPAEPADQRELSVYAFSSRLSPDGSLLAANFTVGYSNRGILVLDLNDGSLRLLEVFEEDCAIPDSVAFSGDGRFYYVSVPNASRTAMSFGSASLMVRSNSILHCVDLSSGEQLWESSHTSSFGSGNDILLYDTTLTGDPYLIYVYANHLDVLDPDSGELLAQAEFSSYIVGLDLFNRYIFCITRNGEYGGLSPDDFETWATFREFADDLSYGKMRSGFVCVLCSNDIICYGSGNYDPNWVDLETLWATPEGWDGFRDDASLIVPGCTALLDYDRLLLGDGDPAHPLRELRLPAGSDYTVKNYRIESFDEGTLCLSRSGMSESGVLYADTATGEFRAVPWTDEEQALIGIWGAKRGRSWIALGRRSELLDDGFRDTLFVHQLDEELNPVKTVELGSFGFLSDWAGCVDPSGRLYVYLPQVEKCLCVDPGKDTAAECGGEIFSAFAAAFEDGRSLDGRVAFSPDASLLSVQTGPRECLVLNAKGERQYTLSAEGQEILAVSFTPDGRFLFSVGSDGLLRRYRAGSGELLSRSELYYYNSYIRGSDVSFHYTESGFLALLVDSYMNLISMEDWGVFAYVPSCRGYLEDRDLFFCSGTSNGGHGYSVIRRYTTDSLMARAQDLLKGWEMSDTQRMQYGLS